MADVYDRFNPQARESLIIPPNDSDIAFEEFQSAGSREPDLLPITIFPMASAFQSAGSREPDPEVSAIFLLSVFVSIRRLARA